jgi:hypothetical protein
MNTVHILRRAAILDAADYHVMPQIGELAVENPIEYRYEKYGAISLSKWFIEKGYEVRLSVPGPVGELTSREPLGGIEPPDLSQFNMLDPQTRYDIYYDSPGRIDLVARKDNEIWLIEAKGLTKGRGAPGTIAEAIGQIVILIDPELISYNYGILLPKQKRFIEVIASVSDSNPLLCRDDFHIFWVTDEGEIELDKRFSAA